MNTKFLSTPPGNHPSDCIIAQSELNVNVRFAVKLERSPQQKSPANCSEQISQHERRIAQLQATQLTLWESPQHPDELACQKRQKPQISSVPGISPRERNRYQVRFGDQVLGAYLSIDKALDLAKRGVR